MYRLHLKDTAADTALLETPLAQALLPSRAQTALALEPGLSLQLVKPALIEPAPCASAAQHPESL